MLGGTVVTVNDHSGGICYNHFMLTRLGSGGPLYRRVYEALRDKILRGELPAGSLLPGTRTLARDLGVSRIVTLAAFERLAAEGYIETRVGSGSRVAAQLPPLEVPVKPKRVAAGATRRISKYGARAQRLSPHIQTPNVPPDANLIDFDYRATSPDDRTVALWRKAISRAAADQLLSYPPAAGLPRLRTLLARHLRDERGVMADPEDVIIVSGAQQALDLAARVLCDENTTVGVEDPHYQGTRQALAATGARVVACAVDGEGFDIERYSGRLRGARAVVVTPSHQFPTGAIMSVARRIALLRWAEANDAWIIEDDYDSEFRYGVGAIPALQGLDSNWRVLYIGTFARMLFPALRLGYLVVPPSLREAFRAAKWLADRGTAPLEQEAIASLLESGAYESMRRRAVRLLGRKRELMIDAMRERFTIPFEIRGASSGTHLFLTLPEMPAGETRSLLARAARRGVRVYDASPYYLRPPRHAALILGYTTVGLGDIAAGVERLARALNRPLRVSA
jgi:GntR family transcriptional regulator/MocR family aminotransferase